MLSLGPITQVALFSASYSQPLHTSDTPGIASTDLPYDKCAEFLFSGDFQRFWEKDFENPCETTIGRLYERYIGFENPCVTAVKAVGRLFESFRGLMMGTNQDTPQFSIEQEIEPQKHQKRACLKNKKTREEIYALLPDSSRIGREFPPIRQSLNSLEEIPFYFERVAEEFYAALPFMDACAEDECYEVGSGTCINYYIEVNTDSCKLITSLDFCLYVTQDIGIHDINSATAQMVPFCRDQVKVIYQDDTEITYRQKIPMPSKAIEMIKASAITFFQSRGMKIAIYDSNGKKLE